jgi:hypothetical protein
MLPLAKLVIFLSCLSVSAAASAGEPPLPGMLSGRVVRPDGAPVAGARVSIYHQEIRKKVEATTDAAGRFRLGPVEPVYRNRNDLFIDATDYPLHSIPGGRYSVFAGRDNDLGEFRLAPGRVFRGRVADVDGSPAAGAAIQASVYRYELGHTAGDVGPSASRVTTGPDGGFRVPPLGTGLLSVVVRVPGRRMATAGRRPVAPGGEDVLPPIRLEADVPVEGVVTDEHGRPLSGVKFSAGGGVEALSDEHGRFTFRGFGPHARFQMMGTRDGFVTVNRGVHFEKDGVWWHDVYEDDPKEQGPFPSLSVTMSPLAWIEGTAVDDQTGTPVKLDKLVLCHFERKANGEVVLRGCRIPRFEQPEPGAFRVAYSFPDEYHITATATGYHDGEAFTPKISERQTVSGVVVRMRRKTPSASPTLPRQTITGKVTRGGKPVASGWVGLWELPRRKNSVNSYIMRGRTMEGDGVVYARALIRDGSYELTVPFQSDRWYVVAEEPGKALTQVGPVPISLNESKRLDIACVEGTRIRGKVQDIPEAWRGQAWVVAFNRTGVRAEAQASPDGGFVLPPLPPGEYGLKAGTDAYMDPEVPQGRDIPKEAWEREAEPWKQAKIVRIQPGYDIDEVEIVFPR